MEGRLKILVYTFLLYGATFGLGIMAAWRHVSGSTGGGLGQLELSLQNGLIFALVFGVFTFAMVRFVRVAHLSLSFFLLIALLAGTKFIFSAWVGWPYDFIGALALVLLVRFAPYVFVHDLAIVLGIAGISATLGLSITPIVACVLLAVLSLYDIISVYRTQHMVVLANRMVASGAVFGFLVPSRLRVFFMRKEKAMEAREVMMLGSGDIGLPLVLATSAVSQSVGAAAVIAIFSLGGLILMQWLFAHQREEGAPMAALPPISMAAILGYVTAIILGI